MARLLLFLMVWLPINATSDESDLRLNDGPGKDLVTSKCAICHSLDYILMNSPILDNAGWDKEIDKMVAIMGAEVSNEEKAIILRYLNANYGK